MNTLVIYDTTGRIISQMAGSSLQEPNGIPFLWVEIPSGKRLVNINTTATPNSPVFEDLPKSETEILQGNLLNIEEAVFTAFQKLDTL